MQITYEIAVSATNIENTCTIRYYVRNNLISGQKR